MGARRSGSPFRSAGALAASLVLAACGGDGGGDGGAVDGGAADGGDPGADAGPTGPVSVEVREGDTPLAAVRVYFQHPDSTLAAVTETDASGRASAMVQEGGFVTVLLPLDDDRLHPSLLTTAGVKPGDELLVSRPLRGEGPVDAVLSVPTLEGAVSYQAHGHCGSFALTDIAGGRASGTAPWENYCTGPLDVLVAAYDDLGELAGSFFAPAVELQGGQTVEIDGTYEAPVALPLQYTAIPPRITSLQASCRVYAPGGPLYTASEEGEIAGGESSLDLAIPAGTFDRTIQGVLLRDDEDAPNQHWIARWGQGAEELAAPVDVSAHLVPEFATPPTYDPAAAAVTWTPAASGVEPDLSMSFLRANRDGRSWSWIAFAPYTGGAIELPTLPVDELDYNIGADDEVFVLFSLMMKTPGGYDAVRARVFEDAPEGFLQPPGPSGVRSWVEYE